MDFSHSPEITELAARTRAFVEQQVIPYEDDPRWGTHGPTDELRVELNALGRAAGLFAPHAPKEFGGLGLNQVDRSVVFEAAGYSLLGIAALHCAAPDEGNLHLLDMVANDAQRAAYLAPLARGARSCFAMTEPDGAGADPSMMQTTAEKTADGYVINGTKWLITGARGASFCIIMARNVGGDHDGGATMFLTPLPRDGISIDRDMDTMDSSFAGGHSVMRFENLVLQEDDILGAAGEGFKYAQVRLAPARLTHCMRWLGAAQRAHDVAARYATTRHAFGKALGEHEGVGFMLADNEIEMRGARLSLQQAAWVLDQGGRGTTESSMAKVQCSEVIWNVVDRSMQILGGRGITSETPVERIFREVRGFRIYDGPSEVHRWSLARKVLKKAGVNQ
ncbi:acyl-CoA dehydrogenase [Actibacterium mucosum KCTC 23349]|uniref:Acyl-CoA dehydrogenase n=1 Tax=Actibacterium mucosum KCTC 23349 TaxID=1454373 RepID=A0A037ZD21_9RHOB|nr:acyl-CoA dehydrogenase family protein [Actibacterium mucosum]KAJ54379.1 acyl-CoA dehydrogenase [Actibacterium mucosum KCTC 23349]